jgi:hypothetical protein
MIHRDHFGDHRDVLSRIEKHFDLRQFNPENRRRLRVEAGPVHDRILVPLLEVDHDFHALLLPNGPDAEDRGDVDQPHTADLHEMPLQLVPASDQHVVAATRI